MRYVVNTKPSIEDIGDAIREKLNVETQYKVEDMPAAIRSIGGGGSGSGSSGVGEIHIVNVTVTQRDGPPEQDYINDISNTIAYVISQSIYDEIIEYYAAGYRVKINLTHLESSYETGYYWVGHIYENIVGMSQYNRITLSTGVYLLPDDFDYSMYEMMLVGDQGYTIDYNYYTP